MLALFIFGRNVMEGLLHANPVSPNSPKVTPQWTKNVEEENFVTQKFTTTARKSKQHGSTWTTTKAKSTRTAVLEKIARLM